MGANELTLRPYQFEAVHAVYAHLRARDDAPVVVIPCGGGKSHIIAEIARDVASKWNGRCLVLAHVQELLTQNANKLRAIYPEGGFGVYSAALDSRRTSDPVIIAGIQSVFRRAAELGWFDVVVIDEAHLIPNDGEGMYRTFLAGATAVNANVRVIGLTATPFRTRGGLICKPENILNHICHETSLRELIDGDCLCNLTVKEGCRVPDTNNLHVRGGEFIASEVSELVDCESLVTDACRDIIQRTSDRRKVLVFAASVSHGEHVQDCLERMKQETGFICGTTLPYGRTETLERFRDGDLKFLVNVGCFTHGLDVPAIDCVAVLRPTMSPGLWSQMVGRGLRTSPGKENCLILDFGGNTIRLGPIDDLHIHEHNGNGGPPPVKKCPECLSIIAASYLECPDCGHVFETVKPADTHDAVASSAAILKRETTTETVAVRSVTYSIHTKRNAPEGHPHTMKVEYQLGMTFYQAEFVCLDHHGYARQKAEAWWRRRSNAEVPASVAEAVELANAGALCETMAITIKTTTGEPFPEISGYSLKPKREFREPGWEPESETQPVCTYQLDDGDAVPF